MYEIEIHKKESPCRFPAKPPKKDDADIDTHACPLACHIWTPSAGINVYLQEPLPETGKMVIHDSLRCD